MKNQRGEGGRGVWLKLELQLAPIHFAIVTLVRFLHVCLLKCSKNYCNPMTPAQKRDTHILYMYTHTHGQRERRSAVLVCQLPCCNPLWMASFQTRSLAKTAALQPPAKYLFLTVWLW